MCELNTTIFCLQIGPDRPITLSLLSVVLVDHTAHPVLVERRLQSHAVDVAGAKPLKMASEIAGELVARLGSRLQRIVVCHEDLIAFHLPPMNRHYAVFEHVSIVVEVVGGKRAGNLNQAGRYFRGSEGSNLPIQRGRGSAGDQQQAESDETGKSMQWHECTLSRPKANAVKAARWSCPIRRTILPLRRMLTAASTRRGSGRASAPRQPGEDFCFVRGDQQRAQEGDDPAEDHQRRDGLLQNDHREQANEKR